MKDRGFVGFFRGFDYLYRNNLYLQDETINKLNKLSNYYKNYILSKDTVLDTRDENSLVYELHKLKEKLFEDTHVLFNELKEEIKYNEIKKIKLF